MKRPVKIDRLEFVRLFVAAALAITALTSFGSSQKLPEKIAGYKVVQTPILVKDGKQGSVRTTEADLTDVSLSGITLEIAAELSGIDAKGRVDRIAFHDFRVNGIEIDAADISTPFEIDRRSVLLLPEKIRLIVPFSNVFKAALREVRTAEEPWRVTGRIFVFG
ncbi:MAG: hypothetical protein ABI539_00820 [Acidobacteriota bacterium]